MRIVHAEDAHTLLRPEDEDLLQRIPQPLPVAGLEVQWIDVLIFLRRILRILDRTIRALLEPLRVFLDPGMIRSALEGNIQGEFHLARVKLYDQVVEVGKGTQLGQDRKVSPLLRANRPRAAHVARLRFRSVVLAFAKTAPDGMYRRQIQHIESHLLDVIELRGNIAE